MLRILGVLGARILADGIKAGSFLPPHEDVRGSKFQQAASANDIKHAPKITPKDRHIAWLSWPAEKILRHDRVLGRLWDTETYQRTRTLVSGATQPQAKRVTYEGPWSAVSIGTGTQKSSQPGAPVLLSIEGTLGGRLGFVTCDGYAVLPAGATIEGERKDKGLETLRREMQKFEEHDELRQFTA